MLIENTTPWPANFTVAHTREGHEQVVFVTKATFALPTAPGAPCARVPDPLPLIEADVPGADPALDATVFESDFAAHKPFCEVLVHGQAHAPEGRPVTELGVGVRLGGWSKRFTVHGPRIWLKGAAGFVLSDKRPFVRQPLSYDIAYGGVDADPSDPSRQAWYEGNFAGIGYYPLRADREGAEVARTSAFGTDATDPAGRYAPMGFGPLGRAWAQRRRFAGTYDAAWIENRMPFLPDDFDDRYHMAAAEDQHLPYPVGGEPVELVNLSASGRIQTFLPRMQIVVVFERRSGRVTQRVANLDTILFLPDEGRVTMTFRTRIAAERDIFEFAQAIVSMRGPEGVADG
ncbi:MAG: DUF2169 domain-containing protein [Rhodobacteraceae bacterium]|nr:DUF2169 domain-containing protein [Paracoccaceae bacterium]